MSIIIHTETDWRKISTILRVGNAEYTVNATVFLQKHHRDSTGNYGSKTEIEVEAQLDGWSADPMPPENYLLILEQFLEAYINEKDWE